MRTLLFGLYLNSLGNYFHREIRDLVSLGISETHSVKNLDENQGFSTSVDYHIIIAPHEFFAIGKGIGFVEKQWPKNIIYITTEQKGSHWFSIARQYYKYAQTIWDIDFSTAQILKEEGLNCYHLALGYHKDSELFRHRISLEQQSTYYFGKNVQNCHSSTPLSFRERPIDIFFIGAWTPRRSRAVAKLGSVLKKWNSIILLVDTSEPIRSGINTILNTDLVCGLEQRSKIVLNIHRDEQEYFESHRIVLHGIGQGALIISEECTMDSQYGNEHITFSDINGMNTIINDYLKGLEGWSMANSQIERATNKFLLNDNFTKGLKILLGRLPVFANA